MAKNKGESVEYALKEKIRTIPDYPKKGIMFKDITPMLKDRHSFKMCIDEMAERLSSYKIGYIIGIEARGFIIGSALAYRLGVGFIPIRKKGKLPYETISRDYALEYGTSTIEMHRDAVDGSSNVFIVDDLLATGGTAKAAGELIESAGGKLSGFAFIIELKDMRGREKLKGHDVISIVKY